MNERRQREARPLVTGLVLLGAFALSSGCNVGPSAGGAQTAVTAAQTAVGAAQTALPGLPDIQATAQAGATQIAGVLSDPQAINAQLQVVLAGATVDVKPTPAGAGNDAVTQLAIAATDTRGTLAQMDSNTRQASAGAALLLVGQYYPKAAISLTLVDGKGGPLLSGTKAPGEGPAFQ